MEYIGNIQDYLSYCIAIKEVLRSRDQKQVDYEELISYLDRTRLEKDDTQRLGHASGVLGMIKGKMDEVRGVDLQRKKEERVLRLDKKILEVIPSAPPRVSVLKIMGNRGF